MASEVLAVDFAWAVAGENDAALDVAYCALASAVEDASLLVWTVGAYFVAHIAVVHGLKAARGALDRPCAGLDFVV